MTLSIETGVQNVTLAIFLTLTVLGSLPLAVTPEHLRRRDAAQRDLADPLVAAAVCRPRRGMRVIGARRSRARLTYADCIPLMREAMIALSQGRTRQLLRGIIDLGGGNAFGVMPGAMLDDGPFGAKLVSVFPGNVARGGISHQGVVAAVRSRHRRADRRCRRPAS